MAIDYRIGSTISSAILRHQWIFFYSESIFRKANIQADHIQYAVLLTGIVNVFCTLICVPLIDRLGRKLLLVVPMFLIILDFIVLTGCLIMQKQSMIYSYLSIACIIFFIMCFAIGLGPIPFVYVAECFRQDARSSALAICMFTNWVANFVLTLSFPYLAKFLNNYVFIAFAIIMGLSVIILIKKMPETKGRSIEEIMTMFKGKNSKSATKNDEFLLTKWEWKDLFCVFSYQKKFFLVLKEKGHFRFQKFLQAKTSRSMTVLVLLFCWYRC